MKHVDPDLVPAPGFALAETLPPMQGAWHQHQRHQLLYARSGTMRLEVEQAAWQLPPLRAAWIGAGVPHRVEVRRPVELRTVYLHPELAGWASPDCRVFSVSGLAREMLLASARWGPDTDPEDALALADRIAVIVAGRIVQVGTPAELWAAPGHPFIAEVFAGRQLLDANWDGAVASTAFGPVEGLAPPLGAVERHFLAIHRKEILPKEFTKFRENIAKTPQNRIIAPYGVRGLCHIDNEHNYDCKS